MVIVPAPLVTVIGAVPTILFRLRVPPMLLPMRMSPSVKTLLCPVPPLITPSVPLTAEPPKAIWGRSMAWMADICTTVPLPRRYCPLVVAPARNEMAEDAEVLLVPPLATLSVPSSVIVPEAVTGPPDVVRPVVPPLTPTDDTLAPDVRLSSLAA